MSNPELKSLSRFQKMRRSALFALLLIVVVGLLFCGPVFTDAHYENDVIEITGIGLIGVAIIGRLWCTLYLGGRKAAEVVTKGPYSIARNPLYVFSAIGSAGVGRPLLWSSDGACLLYRHFPRGSLPAQGIRNAVSNLLCGGASLHSKLLPLSG